MRFDDGKRMKDVNDLTGELEEGDVDDRYWIVNVKRSEARDLKSHVRV